MNTGEIFLKQVVDYFQKKHSGSIVPIDGHSLEKSQSGRIVQLVYGECVRFSLDNSYLDCVVSNGVKVDKNGLMPDLESSLAAFSIPHEYDHEELSKFTAGTVIRNLEIVRINDGKMSFKSTYCDGLVRRLEPELYEELMSKKMTVGSANATLKRIGINAKVKKVFLRDHDLSLDFGSVDEVARFSEALEDVLREKQKA